MALTKIRYDMLAEEVTSTITASINTSGAASPFVFTEADDKETLTQFKVAGIPKNIRSTAITAGGKLEFTLATFTPIITPSVQTLNWDVPATTFSLEVNNPFEDYPEQWISDVASMTTTAGSVSALENFDLTGTTFPRGSSDDYTATYTVKTGGVGYIRPTGVSGGNTGGSASATLTLKSDTSTGEPTNWGTTYAWVANWNSVTTDISLAALTGKTFLKQYTTTNYTVTTTGLTNAGNVVHTVTGTNGTPSLATGSGTLTIGTDIHKDNTTTATQVAVSSVFTRSEAVMGTGNGYTRTLTDTSVDVASGASFSYPSVTFFTAAGTSPTLGDVVDDSQATGFKSTVTVLGHQVNSYPVQAVTNSTGSIRIFWFGVKTVGVTQPTLFKSGDVDYQFPVDKETATLNLAPTDTSSFAGTYNAVGYTFYGINIAANTTVYVVIG